MRPFINRSEFSAAQARRVSSGLLGLRFYFIPSTRACAKPSVLQCTFKKDFQCLFKNVAVNPLLFS